MMRGLKTCFILIFIFFILSVSLFSCHSPSNQSQNDHETTTSEPARQKEEAGTVNGDAVATVNGTAILRSELERAFHFHSQQNQEMMAQLPEEQKLRLRGMILNQLIETEILYQKGRESNITISDDEIKARLEHIKKQYPSEAEFADYLSKNKISMEDVIRDLNRNYVISKVVQAHISSVSADAKEVSDEELKRYYEENKAQFQEGEKVRASHILMKVDKSADAEAHASAKGKLAEILQRAKLGEDFGMLAQQNSECPSSSRGGDLGFFSREQMVPEFSQTAFSLKPGEISDIVQTQFGYHIIKVTDAKPASFKSFEESKTQIKQHLSGGNKGTLIKDYIKSLREQADIKILVPELASILEEKH
ncbi:MAG: peptidylprolyl isomerase [bacterium]